MIKMIPDKATERSNKLMEKINREAELDAPWMLADALEAILEKCKQAHNDQPYNRNFATLIFELLEKKFK